MFVIERHRVIFQLITRCNRARVGCGTGKVFLLAGDGRPCIQRYIRVPQDLDPRAHRKGASCEWLSLEPEELLGRPKRLPRDSPYLTQRSPVFEALRSSSYVMVAIYSTAIHLGQHVVEQQACLQPVESAMPRYNLGFKPKASDGIE